MASTLMTPGVYIEEKNAFPNSAVAVSTAVPVFIGYTEKAARNGKSLVHQPVRISSFAEYTENFGGNFKPNFTVDSSDPSKKQNTFSLNGEEKILQIKPGNTFYFHNSIRLFYANGGSDCYILSVGTYETKPDGFDVSLSDFNDVFTILEKEQESTLIVIPDINALGTGSYDLYQKVLLHCGQMQNRFGIFDVAYQAADQTTDDVITTFRNKIGVNFLNYGAAYYPWLKTSIVNADELNFENLDNAVDLEALLPEEDAKEVVRKFKAAPDQTSETAKKNYHHALKATSITYTHILAEICNKLNELPPSGAMAGIYTMVDNSRGVWKAPANVSLSSVSAPMINITHDQQEKLNVDVMSGKSVNVIRPFPGIGTLVWGARTLDGNSQDWRYINVRRTIIMIEQSLKLATRAYVFEPNDATTWVTISRTYNNFLYNLWKEGALAGAAPEQAYDVQIGLGATMTPNDILDGIMRITVKVAIVRPAEFIVITWQQQQQQS